MTIRVILADDHRIVREGLRELLQKLPDIQVVAEADDGRTCLRMAQQMSPDVIVMDVAMPDMNGIEATRQILGCLPTTKIVALSMYADQRFVAGIVRAGAKGYLLKDCAFEELATAIRTVTGNRVYLSPAISETIRDLIAGGPQEGEAEDPLTARQREVLQLLAEGKAVKDIASHLCVSIKTIETHRQQLMDRLDIHSIVGLTTYAIRHGIITLDA